MKIRVDVILKDGIDKQQFVESFNAETQADWWNMMVAIPNLIVMDVEEDFFETFQEDDRILSAEKTPELPVSPLTYDQFTGVPVTEGVPSLSSNGADYMPLGFYIDSDVIPNPGFTIGSTSEDSFNNYLSSATYYTAYTGKHVDIVTMEVGGDVTYVNYDNGHPDFDDIDNPGTSRYIPEDWLDLEDADNNQVTNGKKFAAHAIGVLSTAAGTICGFAKRSTLRATYLSATDNIIEVINAIIAWHNSKSNNAETGVPNPTILIGEVQYLQDTRFAVNIEDIDSITDLNGTVNKPGGGWGTDLTPFTSRNIIPFRLLSPDNTTWSWAVKLPNVGSYSALHTALESAWDAGIVCIHAAGNNGGVYVKKDDPRKDGVYCTVNGAHTYYNLIRDVITQQLTVSETSSSGALNWKPFIAYGPHGLDKGIDVAAGQNSEVNPLLDGYSNRGPGIDISGLGSNTWSSYPAYSMADGQWGYFSGTSCATPTVVGKAACEMEKYFMLNGTWPTPNQVKEIITNQGKEILENYDPVDWSNVPAATTSITSSTKLGSDNLSVNVVQNGTGANGGVRLTNLAGTPPIRAFWNAKGFNRSQSQGERPSTGPVYPRPKIVRQ